MNKLYQNRRRGFSLIEMMGVVIILGILSAGVTLAVHKMIDTYSKYADVVVLHDMVTVQEGIKLYSRLYGATPKNIETLFNSNILVGDAQISKGEFAVGFDKRNTPIAVFKDNSGKIYDIQSFTENL